MTQQNADCRISKTYWGHTMTKPPAKRKDDTPNLAAAAAAVCTKLPTRQLAEPGKQSLANDILALKAICTCQLNW